MIGARRSRPKRGRCARFRRLALDVLRQVAGLTLSTGLLLGASNSVAASLQISPVIVDFAGDTQATGLTLHNPGDKPLYGQVRVFRWDQSTGEDQLVPTDDLIASPPLIQVAPNSEQLVRLVKRNATASVIEGSYRLLIDELPAAEDNPAAGVTIRLRYSVPVFIASSVPTAQPILQWHVSKENNQWWLLVHNGGNRHAQIAAIDIKSASGKTFPINKGLLGYVLPGRSRRWQLPIAADAPLGKQAIIHAMINASPIDSPIDIDANAANAANALTRASDSDVHVSTDAAPVTR